MKLDVRRLLTLQLPPVDPSSSLPGLMPGSVPAGKVYRINLLYFAGALIALIGEVYLAIRQPVWQLFAIAGIGLGLVSMAVFSLRLTRYGQAQTGVRWLIAMTLLSVVAAPFLLAGVGLIIGLGVIFLVLTVALQTLPPHEANWALFISVGVALVAGGIDLISPPTQFASPSFSWLILGLGVIVILAYTLSLARQIRSYPLTTKLILAFLAVSLIPVGLLAFLNERHYRQVLTREAQQALSAAGSSTAADIDAFIKDTMETVHTEAQLPILAAYLSLPAAQRPGSATETAALATLQELQGQDKIFVTSYALLDAAGQNVLDTRTGGSGFDESIYDYFQKPLETGLPYSSPVIFAPAAAGSTEPALFFSSSIPAPGREEFLGVLRVRYSPAILQKLIVQNNGLIGEQSFAMLFDENYIRLAHGASPELVLKSVVPLETSQLARLQAAGRLPAGSAAALSTNLPNLAAGLDNAVFEPSFTTELESTGNRPILAVAKELETQPWLVVFVQPQDLFLGPIQAQTRTTLFFGIFIAGVVAATAFILGQLLANPLVNLAQTVTQFTAGDLEARAPTRTQDESGVLAASFNMMAEQLSRLLKGLSDRTHELELEIIERQRAEAHLRASEKKYRTLFEESKDAIFITTLTGEIVDMNSAALRLLGYNRVEIMSLNVLDVYAHQRDVSRFLQEIEQLGSVSDFEVQFRRKDGFLIDCLLTATVRQADDGAPLGYQGIIRDVTEQKRAEKERLRLSAIERELTLAQEIQRRLLPPVHPEWPGLDMVCYSHPAREMGGDFYTYYAFNAAATLPGGFTQKHNDPGPRISNLPISQSLPPKYAIAVGDVSGKGMPAALLMAVSLASLQSIISQGFTPDDLLHHLDQAIRPYTRTTLQNCALLYAEIFPPNGAGEGSMRVANAGCVMPLIRRADGSVKWVEAYGMPLGIPLGSELGYRLFREPLYPGDMIISVSDGVLEATNQAGELFSFERLEHAVTAGPAAAAGAMLGHLRREITAFVGKTETHDDLTIVVVRV